MRLIAPATDTDILHHLATTHGMGLPGRWLGAGPTVTELHKVHERVTHYTHRHGVHVMGSATEGRDHLVEFQAALWQCALENFLATA